jgi:uncharacterized protein YybS (DUF2232 family)
METKLLEEVVMMHPELLIVFGVFLTFLTGILGAVNISDANQKKDVRKAWLAVMYLVLCFWILNAIFYIGKFIK